MAIEDLNPSFFQLARTVEDEVMAVAGLDFAVMAISSNIPIDKAVRSDPCDV